jgi:cytochrome c oxidase subunit 2
VTGTSGQSPLTPHSGPEHSITTLWWVMFGGACVGLTLVAVLLLLGWFRRNHSGDERLATRLVVILGISTALSVHVVGHQWFWEIRYPGMEGSTANELHIPVRTRVNVVGTTADVIHSLWVPQLNRKIDLIPGRTARLLLYADLPGTYLGQCAEFCGLQHAHMQFAVVAETRAQFERWLRTESQPAAVDGDGPKLFMDKGCADCHAIRGTDARAHVGPDLTHVASRTTLAAGTIPNDRAHLQEWIADPQHVKPGANMPKLPLSHSDVDRLSAYLEALR